MTDSPPIVSVICGIHEYTNYRDGVEWLVHEWVRLSSIEPFGFKVETYIFGMYRKKCLPLPEENE